MKAQTIELVKDIERNLGFSIDEVLEVGRNEVFEILTKRVGFHVRSRGHFNGFMKVYQHQMNSIVQGPIGTTLKIHDCLDFIFSDGSIVRYSPIGDEGIELTRIQVSKGNRRKGIGTEMVNLTLVVISNILGYRPSVSLECTGSVGLQKNFEEVGLDNQISFFLKSGFVLQEYSLTPPYAKLFLDPSPLGYPPSSSKINRSINENNPLNNESYTI